MPLQPGLDLESFASFEIADGRPGGQSPIRTEFARKIGRAAFDPVADF